MNAGQTTPVAIIGAGPVGLATAYALGRNGVRSVVYERFAGINPHPRAHVVNTKTMEMFRGFGIADAVADDAIGPEFSRHIVWKHTLAGEEFGRLTLDDLPDEMLIRRASCSPVGPVSCAEDRVQEHLLTAVRAQGISEVRFNTPVLGLEHHDDGVGVVAGTHEITTTVAEYVVVAVGSAAPGCEWLEGDWEAPISLGHNINVYFNADLSAQTRSDPCLLTWILNSGAPGVIIAMDGRSRWTYNFGYDPAVESVADFTAGRCRQLVRSAIGIADLDIDIKSVSTWELCMTTAEHYRHDRILLAGDAAHQFPPTGGYGMNTGLADADNLGWKLAAVVQGWAPSALLDSYEADRRPVALDNGRFSLTNAIKMADTGIGPKTREVAARLESADSQEARAARQSLAVAIPEQREHFVDLDQEIGYVYGTPRCPRAAVFPPEHGVIGGRLPHAWISYRGERVSTVDLALPGLTLIAGPRAHAWIEAWDAVRDGIPGRALLVGSDLGTKDADPFGIGEDGAIIVRPDGHIGWRAAELTTSPTDTLRHALHSLVTSGLCVKSGRID